MDFKLGTEVWLSGKGPSLDSYDWSQANEYRIGINEAAFVIPKCLAAIAIDYSVLDKYYTLPKQIIILRQRRHRRYEFENPMFLWDTPVEVQNSHSTVVIAVQLLHYLGARTIHMVGCDSMHHAKVGYADSIKKISGEGINTDDFAIINKELKKEIERLKLEVVWEHL